MAAFRGARIIEQFALVPIYLSMWGVEAYGEWLTLTAVLALLAFGNLGLGQAAAAEIVMAIGAGDRARAQRAFSSSSFMLFVVGLIVIGGLTVMTLHFDIRELAQFKKLSGREAAVITWCAGLTVFLSFLAAPLLAVLSAIVGAGRANVVPVSFKMLEVGSISVAVLLGGTPEAAALTILLTNLLMIVSYVFVIHRVAPWFRVLSFKPDKKSMTLLVRPSVGNLIFLLSDAASLQLPRIILFSTLGPSAVTVYSVTSVYARATRSLSSIISAALYLEAGRAYGAGELSRFADLVNKMCRTSLWSGMALGGGLFLCSFFLIPIWTNGRVSVQVVLLAALTLDAIIGSLYDPIIWVLSIINKVLASASMHFVTLSIGLAISSMLVDRFGAAVIVVALIVPNLVVIVFGRGGLKHEEGKNDLIGLNELVRWPGDILKSELEALLARIKRG